MTTIKNGMMSLFSTISSIVYLNLLWLCFTLLGLVVFGVGPATCALLAACQRLITKRESTSFKDFANDYRYFFKASSLVQLLFYGLGSLLLVNYRICLVYFPDQLVMRALYLAMAMVLVFVYLLSLFNLVEFPSSSFGTTIKLAVFLLFRFPGKSLALALSFFGCLLVLSLKSVLPVLLGASLPLLIGYAIYHGTVVSALEKFPTLVNEG
ncbi:DUF624 domain-containing protein [Vagococcus sp. BWB3-3]|uniref:DUF624 domain-containing protein n=1 Tax=Vagococcus allomyrinae TaxID=2794353 RepID=A0A940P8S7_9ENTE|nr:DUF624 domain-containing protein [Vagococcus allomyrinae]MBP1040195.1 DUF624 domain-containing protein [Vagococcus allomyrinae]